MVDLSTGGGQKILPTQKGYHSIMITVFVSLLASALLGEWVLIFVPLIPGTIFSCLANLMDFESQKQRILICPFDFDLES